jgi:hypothetical protein
LGWGRKGVYHALTTLIAKDAAIWIFGGAVRTFHLGAALSKRRVQDIVHLSYFFVQVS